MASINLNSDSDYSTFGLFPVAQQILGIGTVLKNVIGAIKDIAVQILTCGKEQTPFSIENDPEYTRVNNKIEHLHDLDKFWADVQEKRNEISLEKINEHQNHFTDIINSMPEEYDLFPLSAERQEYYKNLPQENHFDKFRCWTAERREQLENKKAAIKACKTPYNLFEVMPISERIQNIALGIITTIPIVATVYHWHLLQYFKEEKEKMHNL
ncbi:MAG: hypothetical protein H0T62_09770 [Parachlamydiaceae bacterium]|nr:hypothetical protein [Parachlamydiaceae bacterium]